MNLSDLPASAVSALRVETVSTMLSLARTLDARSASKAGQILAAAALFVRALDAAGLNLADAPERLAICLSTLAQDEFALTGIEMATARSMAVDDTVLPEQAADALAMAEAGVA
ncbi:hypothetical protein [Roseomonas sp. WA12]